MQEVEEEAEDAEDGQPVPLPPQRCCRFERIVFFAQSKKPHCYPRVGNLQARKHTNAKVERKIKASWELHILERS